MKSLMPARNGCVLFAFVMLWVGTVSLRSAETDLSKKPFDPEKFMDNGWYGIYLLQGGTKIGFMHMQLVSTTFKGKPAFAEKGDGLMKIAAGGQKIVMNLTTRSLYEATPPYDVLEIYQKQIMGPQVIERHGVRKGNSFEITTTLVGEKTTQQVPLPKETFRDALAGSFFISLKPAIGEAITFLDYDLEKLKDKKQKIEVMGKKTALVDGLRIQIYGAEMTDVETGDKFDVEVDQSGNMISMVMGGMFKVRRETEDLSKNTEFSGDLFKDGMVKVDKPMGPPEKVKRMKLKLKGDAKSLDFIKSDGRQRVTKEASGDVVLEIVSGRAASEKATDEQIKDALRPTLIVNSDHPDIKGKAKELVGDEKDVMKKAGVLCRFVDKHVEDTLSATGVTADKILRLPRGDCSEHSLLFVALARAADIPARQAGGLMYCGDEVRAFGWHAWVEVACEGVWVPLDPTWNQMTLDATHIRTDAGDKIGGMMNLYGRVKMEVLESKSE